MTARPLAAGSSLASAGLNSLEDLAQFERRLAGALPVGVLALRSVESIEGVALTGVVDVDDALAGGNQGRAAETAALVSPLHVAVEIGADQGLPGFGSRPAQIHPLVVRVNGGGAAHVAAPIAAGRIERRAAGVARPAHQAQPDAFVPNGFPGVVAGRDGVAGLAIARRA